MINTDELDLYDRGLPDGVNCVAVPRGDWTVATERIIRMAQTNIIAMRRHIRDMLTEHVDYPALAKTISRRLCV